MQHQEKHMQKIVTLIFYKYMIGNNCDKFTVVIGFLGGLFILVNAIDNSSSNFK